MYRASGGVRMNIEFLFASYDIVPFDYAFTLQYHYDTGKRGDLSIFLDYVLRLT